MIRRSVGESLYTRDNDHVIARVIKYSGAEKALDIEVYQNDALTFKDLEMITAWAAMTDVAPTLHCEECGARKQTIFSFQIEWKDDTITEIIGRSGRGRDVDALQSALMAINKTIHDVKKWKLLG